MDPSDETIDELICIQEGTSVSRDAPRCQHPSSYCPFRDSCPITELLRKMRRDADGSDSD